MSPSSVLPWELELPIAIVVQSVHKLENMDLQSHHPRIILCIKCKIVLNAILSYREVPLQIFLIQASWPSLLLSFQHGGMQTSISWCNHPWFERLYQCSSLVHYVMLWVMWWLVLPCHVSPNLLGHFHMGIFKLKQTTWYSYGSLILVHPSTWCVSFARASPLHRRRPVVNPLDASCEQLWDWSEGKLR